MTMNILINRATQTDNRPQTDPEKELITNLVQAATQSGICEDPLAIINLYVALKARPLAILAGPAQIGKIAIVQCLARSLMGDDDLQSQMMVGHPWYAGKSDNIAFFAEAQSRFNAEKLLSLIEEAWLPGNANRVFLACLKRISPAELFSFFTEVAVQLRHGELMRLGNKHLRQPVPYPPNLFLIGTIDSDRFEWWDGDLLSQTTVIQWPGNRVDTPPRPAPGHQHPSLQKEFLSSCVRSEQAVYRKLHTVLGWQRQPVRPLFQIKALMERYGVSIPRAVIGEAMGYLANAWSRLGSGLFDPFTPCNLRVALDFAISQILLPRNGEILQRFKVLRKNLSYVLEGQFPRSAAFLQGFG